MSSDRLIIVARHDETGDLHMPLGTLTLYDMDGAVRCLASAQKSMEPEWTLAIYQPVGGFVAGNKVADQSE